MATLQETVQQLRDAVARLKGEQGQPPLRPRPAVRAPSSNQERPADLRQPPRAERRLVVVDRAEGCRVERGTLPTDATCKGHEPFVVQDVVLRTDTVRYLREKWEAASTGRPSVAGLPAGVTAHFGPLTLGRRRR